MKHTQFDIPGFVQRDPKRAKAARYRRRAKRLVDLAGVVMLAPVIAPVTAVVWALVRLDGGPGFYGHKRVGKDGREFRCWKLRTMVTDADARLKAHLRGCPEAAREWAQNYKLRQDPRVTRIGRFLRRSSLDELPQFWNVWQGEMSLVGPRPVPREELMEYGGYQAAYLECRPGITGLWQVSGRNDVSYATRVSLDSEYVRHADLWVDLAILMRTVGVVLRGSGR
jgi:lipopolysaccharide/colanic/teichoic acid biosynthesis glycosyltransferase